MGELDSSPNINELHVSTAEIPDSKALQDLRAKFSTAWEEFLGAAIREDWDAMAQDPDKQNESLRNLGLAASRYREALARLERETASRTPAGAGNASEGGAA